MKLNNINEGHALRIAVGITMLVFLLAGSANASTIIVPDNYASIQEAIDNALTGDTIEVHSGTYYENVNVNKQLTLRGIGMPVVDANGINSAIVLSFGGGILDGFQVRNNSNYQHGGIEISSNNNIVRNNTASYNDYGIFINNYGNNTVENNNIKGNVAGIYMYYSHNNRLINNNVLSNLMICCHGRDVLGNYGIRLYHSTNNTITDNTGSNNQVGIDLLSSSDNLIFNNTFSRNINIGIDLYNSSNNNIIYNNYFNNSYNIYIGGAISIGNEWNITKQYGANIIGGSYLGGNFWAQPDGNGYSQKCLDSDSDGICDLPHALNSYNIDYLPLSINKSTPPPPAPELPTIALFGLGMFCLILIRK
jgi:parallel beta-helix repeat protein